jgi:hypothetical protein
VAIWKKSFWHTQPISAANYLVLPVIKLKCNATAQGIPHVRVQLPGGGGHIAVNDNDGNATTKQLQTQPAIAANCAWLKEQG